jgi:hypothetical protein
MEELNITNCNIDEIDEISIKKLSIYDFMKLKSIDKITPLLAKFGIKIAFQPANTEYSCPIFSVYAVESKNELPIFYYDFKYDCNSIVFSSETFEPLLIPPRILSETIMTNIEGYNITKINDGTMFSIYNYGTDVWNIATAHNYDIADKYFMGPLNYVEIIHESFKQYPQFYVESGCNLENGHLTFTLDKGYCHTFIFHHANFHPVGTHGVWQVQSVNLKTKDVVHDYFNSLPCQERVAFKDFNEMFENLELSEYGFILRNGKTDFIIRNNHLNFLRTAIYTTPYIHHMKRMDFILFRAYLVPRFRTEMRKYINLDEKYKQFQDCIDKVVYTMVRLIRPKSTGINMTKPDGVVAVVAQNIINAITETEFVKQIGNRDVKSIIYDFSTNPSFALYFVDLI